MCSAPIAFNPLPASWEAEVPPLPPRVEVSPLAHQRTLPELETQGPPTSPDFRTHVLSPRPAAVSPRGQRSPRILASEWRAAMRGDAWHGGVTAGRELPAGMWDAPAPARFLLGQPRAPCSVCSALSCKHRGQAAQDLAVPMEGRLSRFTVCQGAKGERARGRSAEGRQVCTLVKPGAAENPW